MPQLALELLGASQRRGRREHAALGFLRQADQARGLVDRVADDRVLEALGGADVACDDRPRRDADAGRQLGQRSPQLLVQRSRRRQRAAGRVLQVVGCAEDAQRAVALELVDPAAVLAGDLDDQAEELVEQRDDVVRRALGSQRRRPDHVDEQDRGLAQLAAQLDAALECRHCDVLAHVAAEQVAQLLALPQPGHHAVEARLQHADLAAVVDGDVGGQIPGFDERESVADLADSPAHRAQRQRHRARDQLHRRHAEQQGRAREDDDRQREVVAVHRRAGEDEDPERGHREQRARGGEREGAEYARIDARHDRLAGNVRAQRAHCDRMQRLLVQQVHRDGRRQAAEHDRDADQ